MVKSVEVSVRGKRSQVPGFDVNGKTMVVLGNWVKVASVHQEDWLETELDNPEGCVKELRKQRESGLRADIFTFSQKPSDPTPRFPFYHDWDSVAAIPIISYSDWWTNRVHFRLRQDVKRAAKLGVVVRPFPFTDEFVRAIIDIYDETPVRQGRAFWHYKKSFDIVKFDNSSFLERSEFLGAFWGDELIGFAKIVYMNRLASFLQILSKDAHRDKRPTNALIAKTVELCEARGCSHLIYGKYRYLQGDDSLTAFKRRNGFEEILVPKYYIPLTTKGWLALRLRLYRGAKVFVPSPVLRSLKRVRAVMYRHSLVTGQPAEE